MKLLYRFIATLLVIAFSFTLITSDLSADQSAQSNQGVSDFVTRLYSICLDREPDAAGHSDWTSKLLNNQITGAEAAYGFIFSPEFQNKNVSNEQYVELMYNCFFGRSSDAEGKTNWVNSMNSGATRQEIFAGFANSREFDELCASYGIMRGSYDPASNTFSLTANRASIEAFVTRLYDTFLNRLPDEAGLKDWVDQIAGGKITGSQAAYGFIFSAEYKVLNKSDKDFVTDLYVGFLGRTPDQAGLNDWVAQIGSGKTDLDIFNGFAGSQEWIGLCRGYGIEAGGAVSGEPSARSGNTTPTTAPTTVPTTAPTIVPTTSPSQPSSGRYDPDNHGGYWITGINGSYDQYGYQYNGNGVKVDATQFNNYVNNGQSHRLAYVCSSGYVVSYTNYQNMNWSVVNDPHFGGMSATTDIYRGSYWMQGNGNNDTEWIAAWLYGTDDAWDAFDDDNHRSQTMVVGLTEPVTGQTFMYCEWDASSVYADYDRWANAMSAYSYSNARHSSDVCAQYGVSNETLGDYIMIEWCLGNLDYNLQTLPLPNYVAYTGMGSNNYANYFTTSVSRNTNTYFPVSRDWNYSDRGAHIKV